MRIDRIIVVVCEMIAFLVWAFNIKKIKESKYIFFTIYLGIIALVELSNLLLHENNNSWSNLLVLHFLGPTQFIFYYYFLLFDISKKIRVIAFLIMLIYSIIFFIERTGLYVMNMYFDSLSYGIGSLLLIIAILVKLFWFYKYDNLKQYNQTTFFWIFMGIILFYIGAFPYNNFRNFFWSTPKHNDIGYILHYMAQSFASIMYLMFAYSLRWNKK